MDREPLGWTVKRHVVDVTFRELELPRPHAWHRYVSVGQAAPMTLVEDDLGHGLGDRLEVSGATPRGPSPAP